MTDDKRKKKRGRSKFLRSCFRSEDGPSSFDKSDGRNDKVGPLGKPELIADSGRQGRDFIPDDNLVNGCDADNRDDCFAKRSSPRRRISRILKAVLFNAKLKKIRSSASKSSISSDTSSSSLSSEKVGKSLNDGNAYGRECPDMDDSCSRRSHLFSSSSSRTTSSAYSTSSRTTSSAYSTSSLSSNNSNSRSLFDQRTSSRMDTIDFGHPVSSNSSTLKKSNPINSNSSLHHHPEQIHRI
ncbi:hypothetical protein Ccrd_011156 [Cynara cardunculus var. scolymus]|uniref:Uncharacterized protein n=1 Tax=Cynara cardunculus var. scolymus TaxID=59895 RepID=A0A124SHR3_CYNCS|nr:hypothetical protein Ccrd_011156 [Cynara cardunculus var. scolymus]